MCIGGFPITEAKLSSEKAINSDRGMEEIFWERNWETRVIVIERLSRKGCCVHTEQAASELSAWEEEVFRNMTNSDF